MVSLPYTFPDGIVANAGLVEGQTIIISTGVDSASFPAIGTIVTSGGLEDVGPTGSATNTSVINEGIEFVAFSGTANGTAVDGGGLYDSGTTVSTTINNGGFEVVLQGGTASS